MGAGPHEIDLSLSTRTGHLDAEVHPWGTYTYDILFLEYEGETPPEVQAAALDWNFVKRYKNGYKLWVPESLPVPNGDEPGHEAWIACPAEGPAELRAYYCLESTMDLDADAVDLITLDPTLSERASLSAPTGEPEGHGIEDADQDEEFDGLSCYQFHDSDPGGTWRVVFTGRDAAGRSSKHWRTHDAVPMLAVNKGAVPGFTYCTGTVFPNHEDPEKQDDYRYIAQVSNEYLSDASVCPRASGACHQLAVGSEGAQRAWGELSLFGLSAAQRAQLWISTQSVFLSSGHATGAPHGQAFWVDDKSQWLKPQPNFEPRPPEFPNGEPPTNGEGYWYFRPDGGQWIDASHIQVAIFGHCAGAEDDTSSAPTLAWWCGAQSTMGYTPFGICGEAAHYSHYLRALWRRWSEKKPGGEYYSLAEAAAWAEYQCWYEWNQNKSLCWESPNWSFHHNHRVYYHDSPYNYTDPDWESFR